MHSLRQQSDRNPTGRRRLNTLTAVGLVTSGLLMGLPPGTAMAATGRGPAVLTFWGRSATDAITLELVKQFNATHRDLKVEFSPITDTEIDTKFATALRANAAPDLMDMSDTDDPTFVSENAFENLTSRLKALPYLKDLSPGHLAMAEANGQYYGVPFIADLSVLWYNRSLFKRAGLNPNEPPKNYSQILADAKKIHSLGSNIYGFSFAGGCGGCFTFSALPMAWESTEGRNMLQGPPGKTKVHITGNRAIQELLNLYSELYSDKLTPPSDRTDNGTTWGDNFLRGNVGIEPEGYGLFGRMKPSQVGTTFMDAPLPGPNGSYSTFDGGDDLMIPVGSKNAAGAWEFIKWTLEPKQQQEYAAAGYTPVRTDLLNAKYKVEHPEDGVALKALKNGFGTVALDETQLFDLPTAPFLTMFDEAIYNHNIGKALQDGQSGFDSILASNG